MTPALTTRSKERKKNHFIFFLASFFLEEFDYEKGEDAVQQPPSETGLIKKVGKVGKVRNEIN